MKLCAVSSFEKYTNDVAFDAIPCSDKVSILAARNGYECAQILVFAQKPLRYSATISDLISEDGEVYRSSNVALYAEKYIYVDRNWQTNGLPTGNYPDALIPLDAAIEHGETEIDAGYNKGIWAEFFIPADQKPGIYRGTLTVCGDGAESVSVEIEILSLKIPTHTGIRSLFNTNVSHMEHYEKGDMKRMHSIYLEYLLKHRVCQTGFCYGLEPEKKLQGYTDRAAELYKKGYRTFNLPLVEEEVNGFVSFSDEVIESYLFALAEKSLETGDNLVKCAAFYDWRIDEPFGARFKPGRVQSAVEHFDSCLQRVSKKCAELPRFNNEFGRELVESLKTVAHVVTDYYERDYMTNYPKFDKDGNPYQYDCSKVTLCPKFDGYDTPRLAAPYENCQEKWWYGCNAPNAPYISYHIDDATFSPRLVGGIMARNGITGTLYWVNNYSQEINTTGKPLFLDDPYGTAHRGFGANGDGAIIYPGSVYNIEGPVGSIRLKNIREGHQDWEILNQTQSIYLNFGASFWDIYDRQKCYLADGSKIDSIHSDYHIFHQSVMRLCEAALDPLGLIIKCSSDASGVSYIVNAQQQCRLSVDGSDLARDGDSFYFHIPYQAGKWSVLKVITDNNEREIPLYCGKGMEITLHEALFEHNAVTASQGTVTRNPDEIRREITVEMDGPCTVHIQLDETVIEGQELGFELKTVDPCCCTVYADGYEAYKRSVQTITRWNRIQIPTDISGFKTNGINVCFDEAKKIGIGEVFIRR